MSGTPTSRSTRSAPTERGIAYRTRVPRRRSLRSSRRAGEPSTGRRETGDLTTKTSRYARCETPRRFWESFGKNVTRPFIVNDRSGIRSGRRSLESCLRSKESRAVRRGVVGKVPQGNSPAAYSTARAVPGGLGSRKAPRLPDRQGRPRAEAAVLDKPAPSRK